MALTSVGYAGSVTPSQWAGLTRAFGARYGVGGPNDWKVTAVAGQDRTVSVAAGQGFGHGVLDTTDAAQTVQLATVASGSRWDTIVARRTWATSTTALMAVQGSSTQGVAPGRQVVPGVVDDQPIALVQVTAGQQLPTAVVDVRCWRGDGGMVAASTDALAYLDAPGSAVWVGGVEQVRDVASNGTVSWLAAGTVDVAGSVLYGTYAGQRVKRRIRGGNLTTDGNGDGIVAAAGSFTGILRCLIHTAGTGAPVEASFRVDSNGNLLARMWQLGVLQQNKNLSTVAEILYW